MSKLLQSSSFDPQFSTAVSGSSLDRRFFVPYPAIGFLCAIADLLAILLATSAGYALYQSVGPMGAGTSFEAFFEGALVAALLFVFLSQWLGHYRLAAL